MEHAMQNGPVQGDAAHGFDQPYAKDRARAKEELKSTQAGIQKRPAVPRDDTAMKNPDGDLNDPSAKPVKQRQ
jgi:hypothetical protein